MSNKKNNNQYFIIFIIIGLFFAFNLAAVASQQLTADEITDKVKENQADYQNSKTQTEMVLIDQDGKEEIREIIMFKKDEGDDKAVSYTHLRAHETRHDLVCRLLLQKKKIM